MTEADLKADLLHAQISLDLRLIEEAEAKKATHEARLAVIRAEDALAEIREAR